LHGGANDERERGRVGRRVGRRGILIGQRVVPVEHLVAKPPTAYGRATVTAAATAAAATAAAAALATGSRVDVHHRCGAGAAGQPKADRRHLSKRPEVLCPTLAARLHEHVPVELRQALPGYPGAQVQAVDVLGDDVGDVATG